MGKIFQQASMAMSSTVQTQSSYMPSEYFSGGLSISGLTGNGTDFTSMIDQLRKIEMIPTQRMLRWKADWRARQDAFGVVRESLVNLRDICAKMNTMDKFLVKTATSSQPNFATATASSSAIANSYKLEINQEASVNIWSLNTEFAANTSNINTNTTNATFAYEYNGSVRNMAIPPNTTLEQFKNMINNDTNNPGVRASIIKSANGVTFQIKGMDSGAKNTLSILSTSGLTGGFSGQSYTPHEMTYKTNIAWSNLNGGGEVYANSSSDEQVFSYTYNGQTKSVAIPGKASVQTFMDKLNADLPAGLSAITATEGADGNIQLHFKGTVANQALVLPKGGSFSGLGQPTTVSVPQSKTVFQTNISDQSGGTVYANSSASAQVFTYSYNGVTRNVSIPAQATLDQFKAAIDADKVAYRRQVAQANSLDPDDTTPANQEAIDALDKLKNLSVTIENGSNGMKNVVFAGSDPNQNVTVAEGGFFTNLGTPALTPDTGIWHVKPAENAQIKVDGWPTGDGNWLEVDSNTVSDVVDGVTFNLIGKGTTVINVTTDSEAVTQNVVDFIDAVNALRTTINELTKYDPNKATVDLNYAESQFDMQKGSILTGNYGVQLISTRLKQATAGMPLGFMPRYKEGDLYFGDLYTSLSQLGIKTKADGEGGEGFGLLELNTDPALPMLEDILKKNPEALAEFFSAVNKGVSDSSNFSFVSSMQNISRPGSYDVQYKLDADGKVIDGTAFINGKAAKYDEKTGQIGLVRTPPQTGDKNVVTATTEGLTDFEAEITVNNLAVIPSVSVKTDLESAGAEFASSSGRFYYSFDGQEYSVDVTGPGVDAKGNPTQGDSLAMIAAKINYHYTNPGVTAKAVKGDDGKYSLVIESKKSGEGPGVELGSGADRPWSFTPSSGVNPVAQAAVAGENASYEITYSNPPGSTPKTVTKTDAKTNVVTIDGLPGVTFTLKGENAGTPTTVTGQKHNAADGMYIQIDNRTAGAYSGQVRIKQGKINEILEMLNGTSNKPEEGILGSKGTLQVLVDNYDKIIEGIDKKIEKETARLIKWERTQKLRFSRLEATLKQYESLQASIESQVKQLGSNSGK